MLSETLCTVIFDTDYDKKGIYCTQLNIRAVLNCHQYMNWPSKPENNVHRTNEVN